MGGTIKAEGESEPKTVFLPAPDRVGLQKPGATLSAPALLASLAFVFLVIAADVFGPDSPHLLLPVDLAVHEAVASHLSFAFRANYANSWISDTPITLGCVAIVTALAVTCMKSPRRGVPVSLGVFAMNAAVGGVLWNKDAIATTYVKAFFHRARPSADLHHSFSFPSGHSTSVYFVLGTLFFVVLPALKQVLDDEQSGAKGQDGANNSSSNGSSALAGHTANGRESNGDGNGAARNGDANGGGTLAVAPRSALLELLDVVTQPANALTLTVGGGLTTQTGRLLADVHWVSDVLAGACFGSCGTVILYLVLTRAGLLRRPTE